MTRPDFSRVWAEGGDRTRPDDAQYILGWEADIPTYQVFNYIQNRLDAAMKSMAERGVPEWGADVAYKKDAVTWNELDSTIYIALEDVQGTETPDVSPKWEKSSYQYGASLIQAIQASLDTHILDKANPHKVTPAQLGTYTKTEVDNLVNQTLVDLADHVAATNPHKVTAAQVGAVASTGGTYTGAVTFQAITNYLNHGSIISDSSKTAIANGTKLLGIKADGTPFFDDGAEHTLLTEETYSAARELIEKDYYVPTPSMHMGCSEGIHMTYGSGNSHFTRPSTSNYTDASGIAQTAPTDEPAISSKGLRVDPALTESLMVDGHLNWDGFDFLTLNVVMTLGVGSVSSTYLVASELEATQGGPAFLLYRNPNGSINMRIGRDYITGPVKADGAEVRVTATVTSTSVSMYVDGVLSGTTTLTTPMRPLGRLRLATYGSGQYFKSLKTWDRILTNKQIITL